MKVIGITGLMGSGKTEVCKYLESKNYPVIYADELGHQALEKESPIYFYLLKEFGTNNRKELAKIVFAQPEKLKKLENLSHPVIFDLIQKEKKIFLKLQYSLIFVEAAVLFKMNVDKLCDEVWIIDAPEKEIISRLQKKGLKNDEILKRLSANPIKDYVSKADEVILNNGKLEELHKKIDELINKL
jgi:dephospho-CoA kinase